MKLEDEINQRKPFSCYRQKAMINLIVTNNWVCDQIKAHLKPFDITMQQYNVLRILRGAGQPISTSIIRNRLVDKMADTSRMVKRLCEKGLVNSGACCHDKRKVDVTISQKGLDLVAEIEKNNNHFSEVTKNLSDEEAQILSDLVEKLRG